MADNDQAENIGTGLTKLRHENTALREELDRLRSLFDGLPLGLYQVTPQGKVIMANALARQMLGRGSGEVSTLASQLSQDMASCAPPTSQAKLELREEVHDREIEWHDDDGRAFHIRGNARVVWNTDSTPRYYECTLEDITERRQAEAALRASEERHRLVVEHSPAGILLVDDHFRIIYANPEVCQILGRPPDEIVGARFTDFLHPDSVETVVERYLSRQRGEDAPAHYEIRTVHPDNSPRLSALSAAWFRTSGGAARTVAQLLDITDRTRAEQALRDYTETLEIRNAELDAFADSVAHDLKNPLSTIIGFAEALLEAPDDLHEDDLRRALANISTLGRKMDSIIEELLLFARIRQTAVRPIPIDMRITVQNSLDRLERMRAEHDAQIVVPSHWPVALGHGPWVEEVWVNYISNALTYGGKPPRVTLGSDLTETGQIRFWVRDNGDGVATCRQEQLFNGGSGRDQAATQGHGLGLSIVKRIVSKLGGEVAVDSSGNPGEGSAFSFTLPAATLATEP